MIHAIYKNGQIHPLDEIPTTWQEGQELIVDAFREPSDNPEDIRQWYANLQELAAQIPDEDHENIQAAIAEIRRQDKERMRRQAGLDS